MTRAQFPDGKLCSCFSSCFCSLLFLFAFALCFLHFTLCVCSLHLLFVGCSFALLLFVLLLFSSLHFTRCFLLCVDAEYLDTRCSWCLRLPSLHMQYGEHNESGHGMHPGVWCNVILRFVQAQDVVCSETRSRVRFDNVVQHLTRCLTFDLQITEMTRDHR